MVMKAIGLKSERKYRSGWASVAQQLAQAMGVARDGTGWIARIGGENGDHGLARPLQKVGAVMVGAGSVVLGRVMIQYCILGFGGAIGGRGSRGRSMMRNVGAV